MSSVVPLFTREFHGRRVPARYHRCFSVSGRATTSLIANVTLRAPNGLEPVGPSVVLLDDVWCKPAHRGKGYVSRLLKMAQDEALHEGWAIYCKPVAHDGKYMLEEDSPEQERLLAFYKARDFEGQAGPYLICYPF